MGPNDPRRQPGAYIRDGSRLGRVVKVEGVWMDVEDARSGYVEEVALKEVAEDWTLVRVAPLVD